jgi:hypothetical protein
MNIDYRFKLIIDTFDFYFGEDFYKWIDKQAKK